MRKRKYDLLSELLIQEGTAGELSDKQLLSCVYNANSAWARANIAGEMAEFTPEVVRLYEYLHEKYADRGSFWILMETTFPHGEPMAFRVARDSIMGFSPAEISLTCNRLAEEVLGRAGESVVALCTATDTFLYKFSPNHRLPPETAYFELPMQLEYLARHEGMVLIRNPNTKALSGWRFDQKANLVPLDQSEIMAGQWERTLAAGNDKGI